MRTVHHVTSRRDASRLNGIRGAVLFLGRVVQRWGKSNRLPDSVIQQTNKSALLPVVHSERILNCGRKGFFETVRKDS